MDEKAACQTLPAAIKIYPGKKLKTISPWIYGHFLEPIHHSINGGLHAEMLLEPSFERTELLPRIWVLGNHLDPVGEDIKIPDYPKGYAPGWGEGEGSLFRSILIADHGRIWLGDTAWTDYTIKLKACKLKEDWEQISHVQSRDGFRVIFRAEDEHHFYWWNLGGYRNIPPFADRGAHRVEIVRAPHGQVQLRDQQEIDKKEGLIDSQRWYEVKIKVENDHIECWLDGKKVHDLRDGTFSHGKVGLEAFNSRVEFKDLEVTAADGEVLYRSNFSKKKLPHYDNPPPAMLWLSTHENLKGVTIERTDENPFNSKYCLRMKIEGDLKQPTGIYQENIRVLAGQQLDGYIYLRGNKRCGPIEVGLRKSGGGKVYACAELGNVAADWRKHPFTLTSKETNEDAEFYIVAEKSGDYYLDQVSLMPLSNRKELPFRNDLLEAVKALQPSIIRWPGGCFATHYDWADGIGPIDKRPSRPVFDWDSMGGSESNAFGTDEFIKLCRELGAEPFIVLNVGKDFSYTRYRAPLADGLDEKRDDDWFLQHALDWIEYCNGPADSKWGAVRAKNGHPEPYNVTVWGIDNELWGDWYAQIAPKFCDAIRAKYPDLKLVVVGSVMHGTAAFGPGPLNTYHTVICPKIDSRADYYSVHSYWGASFDELVTATRKMQLWFGHQKKVYDHYSPDRNVKISFDEWNTGRREYKAGMGTGSFLNCLERNAEIVEIAAPALFLRHQKLHPENWFNNALISHDHKAWFPSVTYLVMKLWSQHRAPNLIKFEMDCPTITYKNEPYWTLDAVATEDTETGRVVLKVVNRSREKDVQANIELAAATATLGPTAECYLIQSNDLEAENSFEQPDKITVKSSKVSLTGNKIEFIFPRQSAVLIEFKYEK